VLLFDTPACWKWRRTIVRVDTAEIVLFISPVLSGSWWTVVRLLRQVFVIQQHLACIDSHILPSRPKGIFFRCAGSPSPSATVKTGYGFVPLLH
jgi:hypothetical protein